MCLVVGDYSLRYYGHGTEGRSVKDGSNFMDLERWACSEVDLKRTGMSKSKFYKFSEIVVPSCLRLHIFKKQILRQDKMQNLEDYVKFSNIYRGYTEIDLMMMEHIKILLDERKQIFEIPIDLLLTSFKGKNFADFFLYSMPFYQAIFQAVERYK